MIVSRTPYRVSLFGGGTDFPKWYEHNGGAVIGATINKYCYISVRRLPPFFEHRHRIVYSAIELVQAIDDIRHPSVKAILKHFWKGGGLEIHHNGDLPARSGLGSSSSFTVGLLNAIQSFQGKVVSPEWLAHKAIDIEQNSIGEAVGSQDQVWAAYGGINHVRFNRDRTIHVRPLVMSNERIQQLNSHLLMFFTGLSRNATEIETQKLKKLDELQSHLKSISDMCEEAARILQSPSAPIEEIGRMLYHGWNIKKELSNCVTNQYIDEIYDAGIRAGALGGKLLGAGGGGFMLFFAPPQAHAAIRERLKDLVCVDFKLGAEGSKIVVYEPNGLELV